MTIAVDTHTHSLASGHAYSTIDDLARGARERGLAGFALTDHGPSMEGGPHPYHFGNLRVIPRILDGIRFWKGMEANILSRDGKIDADAYTASRLDLILAGLHEICLAPENRERNTEALVHALAHPFVDAISHPENAAYPIDPEAIVEAAKRHGKALEINDASFRIRPKGVEMARRIARLCAETGTRVIIGSDAHYWRDVGRVDSALALAEEAGLPDSLIVNASLESFEAFVAEAVARREKSLSRPAAS